MTQVHTMVLGTNIWNHYQASLAGALAEMLGVDRFRMALFEDVHAERRRMGWDDRPGHRWIIGPPADDRECDSLYRQCFNADVMIWGDCPRRVLEGRNAAGKLTMVAAERFLKKPFHRLRLLNPRYAGGVARYRKLVNHEKVHALAIGHYAPQDLRSIRAFNDKIWRWGYFADVPEKPPERRPDRPVKILWAGRLLDWKRVDILLRAISLVRSEPWFGECLIVGEGPEKKKLMRLARRMPLDPGRVRFMPPVSFGDVRRLMRDSDIYVLPSDRREGWGVVVNEAMSEGCVVVANEQAGAAQELIDDNETGLLFQHNDASQLAAQLKRLGDDRDLRLQMSRKAYDNVRTLWHPRIAAERLVMLSSNLLAGLPAPEFGNGPCARA